MAIPAAVTYSDKMTQTYLSGLYTAGYRHSLWYTPPFRLVEDIAQTRGMYGFLTTYRAFDASNARYLLLCLVLIAYNPVHGRGHDRTHFWQGEGAQDPESVAAIYKTRIPSCLRKEAGRKNLSYPSVFPGQGGLFFHYGQHKQQQEASSA